MTNPADSDPLIMGVEAAVSELTTEAELAEFDALSAMSTLEIAEERLSSAVQTLTRTTAALRVLRGLAAPMPVHTTGYIQPVATGPEPVRPVVLPGRPDMSTDDGDAPKPASQRSGVQCPGCGDYGTINRNEGYKGTPYTVLVCTACGWERNV